MSFKPEFLVDASGVFYDNALRFATYDEALANARHKAARWMMVIDYRAVESPDPVNYAWVDGELKKEVS